MSEVKGAIDGERDYAQLKGDTGPLVYPAGFVYIYGALHELSDGGDNVRLVQYIFAAFHTLLLLFVMLLYRETKELRWYHLIPLLLSRRVRSIFVLRLFNDGVTMLFLYISMFLMCKDKWWFACFFFSVSVSIKMNTLLFAPALLYLLLMRFELKKTLALLSLCALVQLLLSLPFLLSHPWSYISRSFNFGRQFLYEESVNWRFLQESVFHSKIFSLALLACHLCLLSAFFWIWHVRRDSDVDERSPKEERKRVSARVSASTIVSLMFGANFIGVLCARSLHFQFYSWYFHTIPYLLYRSNLSNWMKSILFVTIEICWNIYPGNAVCSLMLLCVHIDVLVCVLMDLTLTGEEKARRKSEGERLAREGKERERKKREAVDEKKEK